MKYRKLVLFLFMILLFILFEFSLVTGFLSDTSESFLCVLIFVCAIVINKVWSYIRDGLCVNIYDDKPF